MSIGLKATARFGVPKRLLGSAAPAEPRFCGECAASPSDHPYLERRRLRSIANDLHVITLLPLANEVHCNCSAAVEPEVGEFEGKDAGLGGTER